MLRESVGRDRLHGLGLLRLALLCLRQPVEHVAWHVDANAQVDLLLRVVLADAVDKAVHPISQAVLIVVLSVSKQTNRATPPRPRAMRHLTCRRLKPQSPRVVPARGRRATSVGGRARGRQAQFFYVFMDLSLSPNSVPASSLDSSPSPTPVPAPQASDPSPAGD